MSDDTNPGGHPVPSPQSQPYSPPPATAPAPQSPPVPQYPATQQYPGVPQYPAPQQNAAPAPYSAPQPYAPAPQYPGTQPYPQGQPYPYAPARPTSGLAITSLITGIAGIVFSWTFVLLLASIAAVITGHMALKKTRENTAIGGRGMAIAGVILGYAGVAFLALSIVFGILSAIFFGSLPFLLYGISS